MKEAVVLVEEEQNRPGDLSDEEGDPKEEYNKWKGREIARLVAAFKESHPEVMQRLEDAAGSKEVRKKEKKQMRFMQKYYHKGAFYLDDEIKERDFTAPTREDKLDITLLPKVMQVKNFGRAGRTKYTHLADQDTTDKSAGWAAPVRPSREGEARSPPPKRRK